MAASVEQRAVSLVAAEAMLGGARAEAGAQSLAVAIAVVDRGGFLKAFVAADDCPPLSVAVAPRKAAAAAISRLATDTWGEIISQDEHLRNGFYSLPEMTPLGGGLPIVEDGAVIGGIGVSGGHYDQDRQIAAAGLAAAGLTAPEAGG